MDVVRVITGQVALRRWAVASLVGNILIVLTGALVRLTDSGMGCPTWPRCTTESYVPHSALGIHGVIEFANRMLTVVLAIIAVGTWLTAMRYRERGLPRRDLRILATVLGLGIPLQGIIGGITVLSHLNPFVVAFHLLASMAMIALCVRFVRNIYRAPRTGVSTAHRRLVQVTFALMCLTLWLGTVVTGSGPHSGDRGASRTGFDGEVVSHVHAAAVYATVAATIACIVLLRSRAAALLLLVEVIQGVIGFVQFFNGLPIPLVALHLLGASLAIAGATNLLLSVQGQVGAERQVNSGGPSTSRRR